ncbi:FlgD immunoglobulin-like domain containing protein [Streptomyces sp. NPDC004069]
MDMKFERLSEVARRLTLVLALAAVPAIAVPTVARAGDTEPAELVLTAPDRYEPVQDVLYASGDTGYLHRRETNDGSTAPYQWRGYDGSERTVEDFTGRLPGQQGYYGTGTDILPVSVGSSGVVRLRDPATGESTPLTVPDGQHTVGSFGRTVLTVSYNEVWQVDKLHILRLEDGVTTDTPVEPPSGMRFDPYPVAAGDGRVAVVKFTHTYALGVLDLTSGDLTSVTTHAVGPDEPWTLQAAVSPTHIAWYQQGMRQAFVVRRDDPDGAQTSVAMSPSDAGDQVIGLAGDWLLTAFRPATSHEHNPPLTRGGPLKATPLGGGSPVTLLAAAQSDLTQIPGGGAITVGGADAGDWAVRRVEVAADGGLTLRTLSKVPARPAAVRGIALAAGQLVTREIDSAPLPSYHTRTVTLTGTPSAGERTEVATAPLEDSYGQPLGAGDGSVVYARHDDAAQRDVLVRATASGQRTEVIAYDRPTPAASGRGLYDASGRYALYNGGLLVDFEAPGGGAVVEQLDTWAALWGSELWAGGTGGRIEARDLASGAVTSYHVDASCEIRQIQTVGRWVYWDCLGRDVTYDSSAPFGVYDLRTGQNISLPERGKLGDGFVVNQDTGAGRLLLTDFHTGTAAAPRVLTDLPTESWWKNYDVDKYGGGIAWLDADGAAHVVPSGVPAQALTATASRIDTAYAPRPGTTWNPTWQLSKPSTGAQLVIKSKKKVVRTLTPTADGATLTARWDGTLANGKPAAAGTYTWELTATPEDGAGAPLTLTGTLAVTAGP